MQNKRLFIVGGSILAAVTMALLVIPSFIDWSKYQSLAQTKLKEATGYDLTINGALRMAILPSPHANVSNVVVKKPVNGREDAFLVFENADVRLALLPLLAGKVQIASVTLEKPVVNLVTYKDGTDNYTPVKPAALAAAETTAPAAADKGESGQNITVNGFKIEDGKVTLRDEATGKVQEVGIKNLNVKADTLAGPFDGDGKISYGNATFDVSLNTGGYKQGESLPVQLTVKENDNRADVKWSGVVATGAVKEAQGEIALSFGDLAGLLADINMPVSIPNLGERTKISGMLTASENRVVFTNGDVELANTKFKTKFDASGLKSDAMTVSAAMETGDYLDVDALLKVADKVTKDQEKKAGKPGAAPAKSAGAQRTAPLLASDFALPEAMKGDVQIRAKGLRYKGKETGGFEGRMTASGGKGDVRVTLAEIPGGGNISFSAETTQKGVVEGAVLGTVNSLEEVHAKWLGVVDAKTLDQPGMPRRIDLDAGFRVAGHNATATFKNLSLGEPKVTGTVTYTAAARPVVDAKLQANVFTLPAPAGASAASSADGKSAKKADAAPAKLDVNIDPPQLPFDLKFDVALDRLVRADLILTTARAAGAYDGKGVTLSNAQANINGGTLSASGRVADLKNIAGVDMQAGLRTNDLETFYQAMTGSALAMKQKIGDFTGNVKAKGDRKSMAVDAQAQARGFTVSASGTLDDPFSPELPGTLAVRLRHNDLIEAIRVVSPGFGNTAAGGARPLDIAANVKIAGKVYTLSGIKGILGASDIAGSLKADLSGSVPYIDASLTSKNLDVGSLVGVSGKSSARQAAAGASSAPTTPVAANKGAGQWSREPLDTGFMKSLNADIKIDAGTLTYGTWTLTNAKAGLVLKDGALKVSPIAGNMFGGSIDAGLNAGSTGQNQPLGIDFRADVKDVAVGSFLQALTSSTAKRADGTGSVSIAIKGSGTSAAALVGSLNGKVDTKAKSLVIYGMDIDKLAANIVEAFDGGWKGVLAGFTSQGFSGGQTQFKDIDQNFTITNGDMPVTNFRMETTKANAILITNGQVSFARWQMDLQSNVQVTQPKDVPVIGIRLSGPLDAPSKSISSQALDNLVRSKLGDKVQDLLGDKLKNSPAGGLINQFLGGGGATPATPAAPTPTPAETPAATPDAGATAPAPEAAPAPAPQQKSPEQQLLEGVLNSLGR